MKKTILTIAVLFTIVFSYGQGWPTEQTAGGNFSFSITNIATGEGPVAGNAAALLCNGELLKQSALIESSGKLLVAFGGAFKGTNSTGDQLEIEIWDGNVTIYTFPLTGKSIPAGNFEMPFDASGATMSSSVLPVELISFTGEFKGNQIQLDWATASEINNDYFTVERSADGLEFEELDYILGAGNSEDVIEYTFTDYSPLEGINYYRIKQTDFDGTFAYSDIVAVKKEKAALSVNIFPNPTTSGTTNIDLSNINTAAEVRIMDILGRVVYSEVITDVNVFSHSLNLNNLNNGTYLVTINTAESMSSQYLILNK